MKGIWLFVMLLLVACGRDKVAQVSGRVDGEDSVVTFVVESRPHVFKRDSKGYFGGEIPLEKSVYAFMRPGYCYVFLSPGEDLEINLNSNVGPTLEYKGTLGAINNYLRDQWREQRFDFSLYAEEEEMFVRNVNNMINRQVLLLEAKNLGKEFTRLERERIRYQYAEQASYYPRFHRLDTADYRPGPVFDDFMLSFPINNDELMEFQSFRSFVLNYIYYRGRNLDARRLVNYIVQSVQNEKVRAYLLSEVAYRHFREKGLEDADYILPVCRQMIKDSVQLARVARIVDKWRRLSAGVTAPDVALQAGDKAFRLRDFKGSYLYICVWNPWDSLWRQKENEWNELVAANRGKNIRFLTFCMGRQEQADFEAFMADVEGEHFMVSDPLRFSQDYMINITPRYLLIDPTGKIINANEETPSGSMKLLLKKIDL